MLDSPLRSAAAALALALGLGGALSGPAAALPGGAYAASDPVLREGDRGPSVATMQGLLNGWRRRYGIAAISSDGDFGPRTSSALRRFQREAGLAATGVARDGEWDALRRPFSDDVLGWIDPRAASLEGSDRYLRPGASTPDVAIRSLAPVEVRAGVTARPLVFQSGMAIDADGAGLAWRSDPAGQPSTSLRYADGTSVDPTLVPFYVLPGGFTVAHQGVRLGDLAAVVYEGRVAFAIYADVGPRRKIGEGSIALARALGIPSSPTSGGAADGVTYVVFPGSGARAPLGAATIDALGRTLFERAGGRP